MTGAYNRPVAASLRLYRALANAFPYEFKNAYGDELLQVTEDAVEFIWRTHGTWGLVRLLADIAVRVPAEHLAELRQDVRQGLRMLARSPGFTAVALLSLGLGIGIATAAFSEMNGFFLRDIPGVARPGELVMVKRPISYPTYQRYRERTDLFTSTLAYMAPVPFGVSVGGHTERVWGHIIAGSYFSTLGARPAMGRLFDTPVDRPGSPSHVVISHRLWENQFGSDPAIIGKTLPINGRPWTIIGVGPKDFLGASPMAYAADLWIPAGADTAAAPELADDPLNRRDLQVFLMVGRLKPGVGTERASAELDTVARQLEQAYGEDDKTQKGRRVQLAPGGKVMPIEKKDLPFVAGFFAVLGGMVLAIACSNLANMTLARAADRRREIAVRLALGAGRGRLIRQLLTESMLVAAGAGVMGVLFATWLMGLASREIMDYPMPITMRLEPDGQVLLFALALTAFAGLAFGLAPALAATRADLTPALKEGGALRFSRHRYLSARNLLVVSQVAGSLTLLLLTGFLVIGHRNIADVEAGFDTKTLYVVSLDPMREGYSGEQSERFFRTLLDRAKRIPAVSSATFTNRPPMSTIGQPFVRVTALRAAGQRATGGARKMIVSKDYFATLGIPILAGRGFRPQDETSDGRAAIVSEKLVRELWNGENPLGRQLEIGTDEVPTLAFGGSGGGRFGSVGKPEVFQVVGVAKNVREGLDRVPADAPALVYLPLRPADYGRPGLRGLTLMLRAAPGVDALGIPMMSISHSDLMPIRAERSDAGLSQCETVIDIRQDFCRSSWF